MSDSSNVPARENETTAAIESPAAAGGRLPNGKLSSTWLRELALEAGADDAGCVELDRPALAGEREEILRLYPWARTLLALVVRMNRESIHSPARSVANVEFHHTGDIVNAAGRKIALALERAGIRALNPAVGFPMEMDRHPGRTWVVSHKLVAQEAGLGRMGIHRNLIHPRFGNYVLLGTVIVGADVEGPSRPLDFNPCVTCKLCVAACPVGAIGSEGEFNFSACYTHNYREFMSGFTDWVEKIVESRDVPEFRGKVEDRETVSMWQSLSYGANYKAAYCMAVCPAGDEVIAPFHADRKGYLDEIVRPLQEKKETIYVVPGSDAEEHVLRRYPHKTPKRVANGIRPPTIRAFLRGLPLAFQRGKAKGLAATFHFTFTGAEDVKATVTIRDQKLEVVEGHDGSPDIHVAADTRTWIRFLAKEQGIVGALLRRKVRVRGRIGLLRDFARCFPS